MTSARPTVRSAHRRLALLLAATLGLGGMACGAKWIDPPAVDAPSATELHDHTVDRLEGLESVRIRAVLEYYGDEGRARIRQALLARVPADVRMESISPFDTTLSVLVLRDGSLRFYDLQSEQFVIGRAVPEHIGALVPLWLTAEDIVRVLLGAPPLDAANAVDGEQRVAWDGHVGAWRWTLPGARQGELDVWMRHGSWTVAQARASDEAGETVWELRTGEWEDVPTPGGETTELPIRYRFLMPEANIDISLEVERRTLNPDLPDELFDLPTPRGIEPVDLDALPPR